MTITVSPLKPSGTYRFYSEFSGLNDEIEEMKEWFDECLKPPTYCFERPTNGTQRRRGWVLLGSNQAMEFRLKYGA